MAVARRNAHAVYKDELVRSLSFEKKSWSDTEINKLDCAKAGFFYTGLDDVIKCPFCYVEVKDMKYLRRDKGNMLSVLHAIVSRSCTFIKDRLSKGLTYPHCDTDRPWRQKILTEESKKWISPTFETEAKHPTMSNYDARLETLKNFPMGDKKESLAEAGFFFTHDPAIPHSDKVTCFWCDGYLVKWEAADEPWKEHAKYYPGCSYLRKTQGTNYILSVRLTTNLNITLDYEYNGRLRILDDNYLDYVMKKSRFESFTDCENRDDFSKMGFHQVEEDYIMCYHCGLILNKTLESSAVETHHFSQSEKCPMVNSGPAVEESESYAGIRCNFARRDE